MTRLHADAVATLENWHPSSRAQRLLKTAYLQHLAEHPDALSRDCHPDHITASALVVSHDRARVLLNLHGTHRKWMQFGGHCELADHSLAAAALRETTEESGIEGLRLATTTPIQLSRHQVPCGPIQPAHHLDIRYVAIAPADATANASDESIDVAWFDRDRLPPGIEPDVQDLINSSRWL